MKHVFHYYYYDYYILLLFSITIIITIIIIIVIILYSLCLHTFKVVSIISKVAIQEASYEPAAFFRCWGLCIRLYPMIFPKTGCLYLQFVA